MYGSISICLYSPSLLFALFFFKILFIYSWETQKERQKHRQREKQAPWKEPNVGLNPRNLGSQPEPKADAHLLFALNM